MLATNALSPRLSQVSYRHLFLRISALHASSKPASALWRPGLGTRASQPKLFHTACCLGDSHQASKTTEVQPSAPSPQPSPYSSLEDVYPEYKKYNPDEKLSLIKSLRAGVNAATAGKENAEYIKSGLQALDEEEKRVKASDNLFYKAFRSIAWGPTILVNALLALFFG